ncbi:hypothetical protein D018_3085B, partial [Vibrio parahaemolyticus VP2007-007]
SDTIFCLRNA